MSHAANWAYGQYRLGEYRDAERAHHYTRCFILINYLLAQEKRVIQRSTRRPVSSILHVHDQSHEY